MNFGNNIGKRSPQTGGAVFHERYAAIQDPRHATFRGSANASDGNPLPGYCASQETDSRVSFLVWQRASNGVVVGSIELANPKLPKGDQR